MVKTMACFEISTFEKLILNKKSQKGPLDEPVDKNVVFDAPIAIC